MPTHTSSRRPSLGLEGAHCRENREAEYIVTGQKSPINARALSSPRALIRPEYTSLFFSLDLLLSELERRAIFHKGCVLSPCALSAFVEVEVDGAGGGGGWGGGGGVQSRGGVWGGGGWLTSVLYCMVVLGGKCGRGWAVGDWGGGGGRWGERRWGGGEGRRGTGWNVGDGVGLGVVGDGGGGGAHFAGLVRTCCTGVFVMSGQAKQEDGPTGQHSTESIHTHVRRLHALCT